MRMARYVDPQIKYNAMKQRISNVECDKKEVRGILNTSFWVSKAHPGPGNESRLGWRINLDHGMKPLAIRSIYNIYYYHKIMLWKICPSTS